MGNINFTKFCGYNKLESINRSKDQDYSGPYIFPEVNDFQKEIEEKYKNKTLIQNNIEKMIQFKDRPCLGRRLKIGENEKGEPIFEKKYTYYTYSEVHTMCKNFAKNLHEKREELIFKDTYKNYELNLVGIFAKNCTEWVLADMGCQMDSITTVTLYSTLGQDAFKYICNETKIKTILVSPDLVKMLCEVKKKFNLEQLSTAILFDLTTNCDSKKELQILRNAGFNAYSFRDNFLKENDTIKDSELIISKPDTILTICYTSGTTGNPKGVMLCQSNLICVLETCIYASSIPLDEFSCHISFLPLAHIFERMVISGFMGAAAKVGFISGSLRTTLMEDISILGPTLLFTVPRILQTIRTKVFDGFNSLGGWKKKLAYKAYNAKLENYKKYGIITHTIYDQIIFKKIRAMFGNRIKAILCASAPMPKTLADDFKIFLSVPVIEGLGMTELSGAAFATNYHDLTNNTTGGVTGGAKMIIKSVPDLGYTINDVIDGIRCPSGEICLKGPLVFKGYYKNDAENEKSFDKDGYFHTGDVGRLFPQFGNGLKVVDRVKEIFKLSQGEYIIPAKLESVYSKSEFIHQIMIYGNSSMNNIIAIICPDKVHCANALNIPVEQLINCGDNKDLKNLILKDLLSLANEANFNGLEKVKYFLLDFEGFTIENGCMTPTMKVVRKKVELKFKSRIDKIYSSIPMK